MCAYIFFFTVRLFAVRLFAVPTYADTYKNHIELLPTFTTKEFVWTYVSM